MPAERLDGGDVDDAATVALVDQHRQRGPGEAQHVAEVDGVEGVPLLFGGLLEPAPGEEVVADVVHDDVEPAVPLERPGDEPGGGAGVTHVEDHGRRLTAGRARRPPPSPAPGRRRSRRPPRGPVSGEGLGDATTQAPASAGDDRHPARQQPLHRSLLVRPDRRTVPTPHGDGRICGLCVIAAMSEAGHAGADALSRVATRPVVVVVFPGVQSLDVTGPVEVLRHGQPLPRRWRSRPPLATTSGWWPRAPDRCRRRAGCRWRSTVGCPRSGARSTRWWWRAATVRSAASATPSGRRRRRRLAGRSRRVTSVCTGAFVLAAAGPPRRAPGDHPLGAVRRCWPRRYPAGDASTPSRSSSATARSPRPASPPASTWRWRSSRRTSAGGWRCSVARQLVVFLQRPGGQSQFSAQLAGRASPTRPLATLQRWPSTISTPTSGRAPRRARRHEPAATSPATFRARGRHDAGPLRRAGAGRGGPPAARGLDRRRRRDRPPLRVRHRRDPAAGVPPPLPRRPVRLPHAASDPPTLRSDPTTRGGQHDDHDRDPPVRRRRGARLRRPVGGVHHGRAWRATGSSTIAEHDRARCAAPRACGSCPTTPSPTRRRSTWSSSPAAKAPGARSTTRRCSSGCQVGAPLHLGDERLHRLVPARMRPGSPRAGASPPTGRRSRSSAQRGDVTVVEDVRYVRDGNVVTSAGVSAGIDMSLWLVGQL